jgi:DNA polymerase-1
MRNLNRRKRVPNATLRSCIVAEQGYTFLSLDASQIELRVVAILSQDPLLLEAIKSTDLHLATAIQVFGWTDDEAEMKQRRYNAKQLNFAILYGADEYKIAEMSGCTVDEAKELIKKYFETYVVLDRWIKLTQRQAKSNGYVTNLFGRIRPIPEFQSGSWKLREKAEREAVNTVVQGTAIDIIKKMMLYLRSELDPRVRLVLNVHDEMLWECPDDLLQQSIETSKELTLAFPDYPCKLVVGTVYGEMKEIDG